MTARFSFFSIDTYIYSTDTLHSGIRRVFVLIARSSIILPQALFKLRHSLETAHCASSLILTIMPPLSSPVAVLPGCLID